MQQHESDSELRNEKYPSKKKQQSSLSVEVATHEFHLVGSFQGHGPQSRPEGLNAGAKLPGLP